MTKVKFINPYNFIPLGGEKANENVNEKGGGLTGTITYSVYTKTPLFIPNTSNDEAFKVEVKKKETEDDSKPNTKHRAYDFFSYTDLSRKDGQSDKTYEDEYFMPVIPGSEIRGMLRSNYEILTDSCMSTLNAHSVLSKRTMERFRPALIKKNEDGTYELNQAKDYLWRTKKEDCSSDQLYWKNSDYTIKSYRQKNFPEGCPVYFEPINRGQGKPLAQNVVRKYPHSKRSGCIEGYILKGEDGPVLNSKEEKHCCHIFVPKEKRVLENISSEALEISLKTLDIVLDEYKKNGIHFYTQYKEQLDALKKSAEGYFPVYYSNPIEDYIMLSPACITREIYKNKLANIVGKFNTCTDKNNLCPACSLFGMIGENFQSSSRIRFSDLHCVEPKDAKSCYDKIVTLQPLAAPHLNNMEFYVKKPKDARFWTYDYYIDFKGNVVPYQPEINGRKFYWHQMDVRLPENVDATHLNMTIRPVRGETKNGEKRGVRFSGKLYFEMLTEIELNQLLWLLNAGDYGRLEKKTHGYKLGAAKPLGLGSVAISVDEVCLRKVILDREKHTVRIEEDNTSFGMKGKDEGFAKDIVKNFKKMTSFDTVKGKNVRYPITEENPSSGEESNGYEWFVKNHGRYDHKNPKNREAMPRSREEMCYYEYMEAMEPELRELGSGEKKGEEK